MATIATIDGPEMLHDGEIRLSTCFYVFEFLVEMEYELVQDIFHQQ